MPNPPSTPAELPQPVLALITVALIGFAIGYLISRNSSESRAREAPLEQRSRRPAGWPTR